MADLLNFNPNRKLEFEPGRPLDFDMRRPLEFDPLRDLEFEPNRDLGFGHRGVVFRGYVCPVCGSLVTEDAKRCTECGAVFEPEAESKLPPPKPPAPAAPARPAKPTQPASRGKSPDATYCAFCGARLKPSDGYCWNCGKKARGASGVPPKTPSAPRDWQRGR